VLPGTLAADIRTDVKRFFARRSFYAEHRLPWKRGLLFVGPPGNGKTQTLKALLREVERPVVYVKSFHHRDETEDNIRTVFSRARRVAPAVLVMEDLDCLVEADARSALLNELDGFAENTGLLVIATTNHPEKLDRSILDRPSRFDRKFHFPLPGELERRAYLERWNQGQVGAMRLSADGVHRVAKQTKGFTFAYLKELMLSASLRWADDSGPMDLLAAQAAKELGEQMASTAVVLGPIERNKSIGFA
jgi:AAA+ superfamily predicted ATPase